MSPLSSDYIFLKFKIKFARLILTSKSAPPDFSVDNLVISEKLNEVCFEP